jgi:hypothetical protein
MVASPDASDWPGLGFGAQSVELFPRPLIIQNETSFGHALFKP